MNVLNSLKEENQDFEWYPTTAEIIEAVKADLKADFRGDVLDIGAGDGRVLNALTKGDKYAIEKSKILIDQMPKDVVIVGTDFYQSTLVDKRVEVIFCNPPYSEFEHWAEQIILQGFAEKIYLVIPERWQQSEKIQKALEKRSLFTVQTLGNFDFFNAERQARAKVQIVKLSAERYANQDPFALWFDTEFAELAQMFSDKTEEQAETQSRELLKTIRNIETLEQLYQKDLAVLYVNYKQISSLNKAIFKELDVDLSNLRKGLKKRIQGLKSLYWKRLFDLYEPITSRLTQDTRQAMLNKLNDSVNIDFTVQNAYAVTLWAIKNANSYFDDQLVKMFEKLSEIKNVIAYKSNQKLFKNNNWRYLLSDGHTHFKLDYRLVVSNVGSLKKTYDYKQFRVGSHSGWGEYNTKGFIEDLLVIANNLGFDVSQENDVNAKAWDYGERISFFYYNHTKEKNLPIFDIKIYQNGNVHLFLAKEFALAINVNVGRILKWIRSPKEASEEMGYKEADVMQAFNANFEMLPSPVSMQNLIGYVA